MAWNCCASAGFSSTLTLTTLMRPAYSFDRFSSIGPDHAAGSAPRRPQVHQYRHRGADLVGEGGIGRVHQPGQRLPAGAAVGRAALGGADLVLLATLRTDRVSTRARQVRRRRRSDSVRSSPQSLRSAADSSKVSRTPSAREGTCTFRSASSAAPSPAAPPPSCCRAPDTTSASSSARVAASSGAVAASPPPAPCSRSSSSWDVIDPDMPHFKAGDMPFIVRTPTRSRSPAVSRRHPAGPAHFHWTELWGQLRRRVPDGIYHEGVGRFLERRGGRRRCRRPHLRGRQRRALRPRPLRRRLPLRRARRSSAPMQTCSYRGYMLWRGLLPRATSMTRPWASTSRASRTPTSKGNATAYFVPSARGATVPATASSTGPAIIPLPAEPRSTPSWSTATAMPREGSLPPGSMRPDEEARLKELMRANLPDWYGEMIGADRGHLRPAHLHRAPLRPTPGAGCASSAMPARSLRRSPARVCSRATRTCRGLLRQLDTSGDLDAALRRWSDRAGPPRRATPGPR